MSTKNNATLTKAVLHLRESVDAEWLQNIAIEGKPGSTGATGPQGLTGKDGKTYTPILREVDGEVFVDFYTDERTVVGTINIKGANGVDGINGIDGVDGKTYTPVLREEDGKVYLDFVEGDTTISGAVNLKGEKGEKGEQGADGKSAYDIAVENGYEGTEAEYTALATSVSENAQAAENARDKAVASATSASTSASNAQKAYTDTNAIKTELQGAVEEASGVADRVTLLETGKGAYKDPTTGEMFYFEPLLESDGTIAVIKNNGVAWQIAPVEWAFNGGDYVSQCRAYSDGEYVYFMSTSKNDTYSNWLYVVYDNNLNRVSPILTCKNGYGIFSSNHYGAFACFATDDFVFCQNKYTTNKWTCFDKATGAKVADYSPSGSRLLVYNKKTTNILAISLTGAVSVLSSARDNVFAELASYDASEIFALQGNTANQYYCAFVNRAAYHTYFCARNKLDSNTQTLYRVNDDDTISVVDASYGTTDADGKVIFEEGVTFDDCIVTKSPITTENGLIPFNKSVSRTVNGSTSSAWASMPIMFSASNSKGQVFHVISNGLNFYIVLPDGRCVEANSIGTLWAWIRNDMWNGKPVSLPALTLGTVEADAFLPNRAYHGIGGAAKNTLLGQLVCKSTLPSGTVFPLREAMAGPNALPKLGDQKSIHAPAPLLASKIAIALPMNSPWGIVGVPSHLIRGDFS